MNTNTDLKRDIDGRIKYTFSPHILHNTQHLFGGGVRSALSLSFFKNLILKRGELALLSWGTKTNESIVGIFAKFVDTFYLEDGIYRSLYTGKKEPKTKALIVDRKTAYYNAEKESSFDELVSRRRELLTPEKLEEGRRCLDFILKNRLSKYNDNIPLEGAIPYNSDNILIVDQTKNDQSVIKGKVPKGIDIVSIIEGIKKRRPDARIFVKVHPEVILGDKESSLDSAEKAHLLEPHGVVLVGTNYNPIELMDAMEEVHVLTSQMGFEALLLGKAVFTYGEPFYAKYRLTQHISSTRNNPDVSVLELFTLFCILYSRYFDKDGKEISFLSHLENILEEKTTLSTK